MDVDLEITLSTAELQIMRNAFDIFDRNKDGTIDPCEFGTLLQAIGYTPTLRQIWKTLCEFDKNGDGVIDFGEFVEMSRCFRGCSREKLEENLRQAFRVFDRNGDGFISADELRVVVTSIGDTLTQQEAEELISLIDRDGDGKLVYEEFVVIARKSLRECIKSLEHRKEENIEWSHSPQPSEGNGDPPWKQHQQSSQDNGAVGHAQTTFTWDHNAAEKNPDEELDGMNISVL